MAFRADFNPNVTSIFARGTQRGARLAGEYILEKSNQRVPIEDFELMRSGRISQEDDTVAVAYGAPHAVKQHEDRRLEHDPGRTSKYLERAFNSEKREALNIIARELRGEI